MDDCLPQVIKPKVNNPYGNYLECPLCDFSTNLGSKYNMHIQHHTQPSMIQCPFCVYKVKYEMRYRFRDHLFIHLDEDLVCTECGFKTRSMVHFRKHYFAHKRDFQCPQCPYVTRFDYSFKEHMNRHNASLGNQITDSNHKKCPVCGIFQHGIKTYYKHVTNHAPDFSCRFCDNEFKTTKLRNLRRHILSKHSKIV